MRKLPANVHKRLAAIENRSVIDKPYMLVPEATSLEAWNASAMQMQQRLKFSVKNGDVAPDYSGVPKPALEPVY